MKSLLALTFLLIVGTAQSATRLLLSSECQTSTSVRDIIAGAGITDGDTVQFPSGTFNWTTQATCSVNKNIILKGAGMGATTINGKNIFTLNTKYVVDAGATTTPEFRMTGFSLTSDLTGSFASPSVAGITLQGLSQNVRIDHISWEGFSSSCCFWMDGYVFGVMDHCTIDEATGLGNETIIPNHPKSPPSNGGGGQYGDYSWANPVTPGSVALFYIEDGVFLNHPFVVGTLGSPSGGGARYVFRHNYSAGAGGGGHGTESGFRSLRYTEAYNNYYTHIAQMPKPNDRENGTAAMNYRGGTGTVFNNRYTMWPVGNEVSVEDYRCGQNWRGFNSGDGLGPWDRVDRTVNSWGAGAEDGTGITTHSYLYASGTGAVIDANGVATLPGLATPGGADWRGYTLRIPGNASNVLTSSTAPVFFNIIGGNGTAANKVQLFGGRSGYPVVPVGDTRWEIRHVLQFFDAPGNGAGDLLITKGTSASIASNPSPNPQWPNQAVAPIYQWNNKSRATTGDVFAAPVGFHGTNGWSRSVDPYIASSSFVDGQRPSFSPIASPTNAQLRIGNDGQIPGGLSIDTAAANGAGATQAWGYTYPHPLTLTGGVATPTISSSATISFVIGASANTFVVKTLNFTGTPTITKSAWSPSLPSTVTFQDNGNGTATVAGTATGATAGQYTTTFTATSGAQTYTQNPFTLTLADPTNSPPTVSLATSQSSNIAPSNVTLTATASDPNGSIAQVEFYANATATGTPLATDSTAPYVYVWSAVPAGVYSVTAKAWDSGGLSTVSAVKTVTINDPAPTPTPTPGSLAAPSIVFVGPGGTGPAASATPTPTATPTPAAPSALTSGTTTQNSITIAWTDNSTNETGFKVERATGAGAFSQIALLGANVTGYTATTLTAGTAYSFRVRATNSAGNSAYSNTATATTDANSSTVALPRGVFDLVSAGGAITNSVVNDPNVDGVSIRLHWNDLAPTADGAGNPIYSWTYLDAKIAQVEAVNKSITLRIGTGSGGATQSGGNTPDWVMSAVTAAGGSFFSFYDTNSGGITRVIPVFWDQTFLQKKKNLMADLGARYGSKKLIKVIYVGFANGQSMDWSIPDSNVVDGLPPSGSTERSRWLALGYTSQKIIDAGCPATGTGGLIDAAMTAFPSACVCWAAGGTSTAMDPVAAASPFGQNYAAQTTYNNALAKYKTRAGVQKDDLSQKTAQNQPFSGQPSANNGWTTIYRSRPQVAAQMVDSATGAASRMTGTDPARTSTTLVLRDAIDCGISYSTKFQEIYQSDLENTALNGAGGVIEYAHTQLNL